MSGARKINYIITQVTPIILFAIFHRYTDIVTTKTSFVMIFRHGKTMPLKTSRLITLSLPLSLSLILSFFFQTSSARQDGKGVGRDRTDELHIISWYKRPAMICQRGSTEFGVNLSTAELTEGTMPASAIYCKSIALTRSL